MPAALRLVRSSSQDPGNETTTSTEITSTSTLGIEDPAVNVQSARTAEGIDISEFYPATAELQSRLAGALDLLRRATTRLEAAIEALRSSEKIEADDELQKTLGDLQEAFCLRDLSDGYAVVVNASTNAIRSLHGKAASEQQLLALAYVLRTVRQRPFMGMDKVLPLVEKLDDAGWDSEGEGFDALADWLNGDRVS